MAVKPKPPVKPKVPVIDPRAAFIAKYPQYARLFDGGVGEQESRILFGDDLINLILDVGTHPKQYSLETQAGLEALDAKIRATRYWNDTTTKSKNFDALTQADQLEQIKTQRLTIANGFNDLGLTVSEIDNIAKTTARSGITGAALNYYINSVVGSKARGTDDLLASTDAQGFIKVAKDYGYNPPDLKQQVLAALQGKEYNGEMITSETFKRKGMAMAKAAHFSLSPQLDAGLTLAEIFSPYRKVAADLLDVPENSIDFNDLKYKDAFGGINTPAPTLSEWESYVMTNPKFKYGQSAKAKNDARSMVMTIAKAFGEVI
jgi:hypothetical protein